MLPLFRVGFVRVYLQLAAAGGCDARAAAKTESERTNLYQVAVLEANAFSSHRRVIYPGAGCAAEISQAKFAVGEHAQLAVHRLNGRVIQNDIAQVRVAAKNADFLCNRDGFFR